MRRGGRMGQVAVGIALRQVQRASSLTGHSHWQITPVACTATKCRSTPKCRMNDSSTLCSMKYDPATEHGYVYFPGWTEEWYRLNVSTIFHGVEGKWFPAWSVWEGVARPLIARAKPVK